MVGDALAKTELPFGFELHEQKVLVVDAAEAGFEEADERQPQQAQLETIDPHDNLDDSMQARRRLARPHHGL